MEKKDFYYLGKIVKTSGYKGSLVFFFDVDDIGYYQDLDAVFVELAGELIPFVIADLTIKKGNQAFVTLEDVDTEEEAVALTGSDLYLPLSYLPPLAGKKFYFHEVAGFRVVDSVHGDLGTIREVIDRTSQPFMVVRKDKNEILIPLSDDIIRKVDRENRVMEVATPEGLVGIYLDRDS